MREFVYGSDQKYAMLKDDLENLKYKWGRGFHCTFPRSFSRPYGRIGFEINKIGYALFIDKGITCSLDGAPPLLLEWLSTGTLHFLDFTDVKEFLRSLTYLY